MNRFLLISIAAVACTALTGCSETEEVATVPAPTSAATPPPADAAAGVPPAPVSVSESPAAPPPTNVVQTDPRPPAPAPAAADAPPVTFDPPTLDFGILPPGTKARGLITIRNESDRDLRILGSKTSCGCTATTPLRGRVVAARSTLTFEASMQLKSGLGPKKERLAVLFEGFAQGLIKYDLTAEASLPVRAVPPNIDATETLAGTIELIAQDGAPFTVLTAGGAPPRFIDFEPGTDAPRDRYVIEWDLTAAERAGDVPWFWVVETDRPDSALIDLRVRHATTRVSQPRGRPWVPKDQRIVVGTLAPGVPVEFETHVDFAADMDIPTAGAAVTSPSPNVQTEVIRAWVEGQSLWYRVRLTVTGDAPPGPLYETLTLTAMGYDAPLRVLGRLKKK